jgi:hypothetical protein
MTYKLKLVILIILFLNLSVIASNKAIITVYNNKLYGSDFIGNWYTINIKTKDILFTIVRKIKIEFKKNDRFIAEANFILGFYKKWGGSYKISNDKIYLKFDNGVNEILFYSKINNNHILCRRSNKISAYFIRSRLGLVDNK